MHPMFDVVSLGFARDTLSSTVHSSVLVLKLVTCEKKSNKLVSICLILAAKVIFLCNKLINPVLGLFC